MYAVRPLTPTPVPELRIYKFWESPVGPHPVGMFEVNVFTPAQFGAFVSWLAIHRGPLSALIHPNVIPAEGDSKAACELRDHSERATWMGQQLPLDYTVFYKAIEAEKSG
ncbi:DOPA 4,5-dioxygenase family protein [Candidatus Bathyarchaeota archaeon]|nr:DOPA 4,5-dioxygenase family protein [Candidatus Bathyarchaeota archaeon]